jgi:hypothetical protein
MDFGCNVLIFTQQLPPRSQHAGTVGGFRIASRQRDGGPIVELQNRANDTAISIAMLETAFDRFIELLGESDAFDLIESALRQRAEIFRRSLQ